MLSETLRMGKGKHPPNSIRRISEVISRKNMPIVRLSESIGTAAYLTQRAWSAIGEYYAGKGRELLGEYYYGKRILRFT